MYIHKSEVTVPRDRDEVFLYFDRPENLAAMMPARLGFSLLTPHPIMRTGTVIDYRIRFCGIPLRWTAIINDYKPPHRFVDIQLKGPYSFWHHEHLFEVVPGGTRISDEVRYALPFGLLGNLIHAIGVRKAVQEIFDYRRSRIVERFGQLERKGCKIRTG